MAETVAADVRPRHRDGAARTGAVAMAMAIGLAGLVAWLALELARRDADIGTPKGADRLIQAVDAEPGVTPAEEAMARQVLRERPNDGRGMRVLGQFALARGDAKAATGFHQAAVRWAPRDRLARAVLVDEAFAQGDVPTALQHLDALMRVAPASREALLQNLVRLLHRQDVRAELVSRLRAEAPWRGDLAHTLRTDAANPLHAEALLAELAVAAPLTAHEWDTRVVLLQRLGEPGKARAAWLSSLSMQARVLDQGALFDGGFEALDTVGGFAWRITPQAGVIVLPDDYVPAEGQGSLSLVFEGRAVTTLGLEQPLALAPGQYRISGFAQNDTTASRPFLLEIICLPSGPVAGQASLPAASQRAGWQAFSGMIEVPGAQCAAQHLRLRHAGRTLNERMIRGTLRLDAIKLRLE